MGSATKISWHPPLRVAPAVGKARIEALDFARGLAVTLMILSHGMKGLLSFAQFPPYGLVPVHLLTKFSSSLFLLVFGISLAVVYGPHLGTAAWPARRRRMLVRGLKIFFWYKVLTIAEMTPLYTREEIMATLLYRAFPVYVEILGFYAIALLWMPFFLPLWARLPALARWPAPILVGVGAVWLAKHFSFGGSEVLRAILVEHDKHYTWGQLARLPLVLVGLEMGRYLVRGDAKAPARLALGVALLGVLGLVVFYWINAGGLRAELFALAHNEGKHPPELSFSLFSVGGALLLLGASLAGGGALARWLRPITWIGTDALQAFICHIFVIFVFYRYLLGYWQSVSYEKALGLTALAIALTALWIKVLPWIEKSSRPSPSSG